jgi:hypothetical protein
MFPSLSIKLTPAIIKALARGLINLARGFGSHLAGTFMLILVILAVGAASAMYHAQIVLA